MKPCSPTRLLVIHQCTVDRTVGLVDVVGERFRFCRALAPVARVLYSAGRTHARELHTLEVLTEAEYGTSYIIFSTNIFRGDGFSGATL